LTSPTSIRLLPFPFPASSSSRYASSALSNHTLPFTPRSSTHKPRHVRVDPSASSASTARRRDGTSSSFGSPSDRWARYALTTLSSFPPGLRSEGIRTWLKGARHPYRSVLPPCCPRFASSFAALLLSLLADLLFFFLHDHPPANLPDESIIPLTELSLRGVYYGYARVVSHPTSGASRTGLSTPATRLEDVDCQIHPMVMSVGWNPYYKNERLTAVRLIPFSFWLM
jgi:hypothetical protein